MMGGDRGEVKGWKMGGIERDQRGGKQVQSFKRAQTAPPPSPSVILAAFEVDRRPVFTPVFRLRLTVLRLAGHDSKRQVDRDQGVAVRFVRLYSWIEAYCCSCGCHS